MPIGEPHEPAKYFLVSFLPSRAYKAEMSLAAVPERPSPSDSTDLSLGQLQQYLSSTKLYLNSLLDEREATNQELISANEEIRIFKRGSCKAPTRSLKLPRKSCRAQMKSCRPSTTSCRIATLFSPRPPTT